MTPADAFFAKQLRRLHVPIVLAVNKCEGGAAEGGDCGGPRAGAGAADPDLGGARRGLGRPLRCAEPVRPPKRRRVPPARTTVLRLAIVGRPNVGKVDAAQPAGGRGAGHHRRGAGADAGISIAVRWSYEGRAVELVDTAGNAPPRQDGGAPRQALLAGRRARARAGRRGPRRLRRHRSRRPSGHGARCPRGRRRPCAGHPAQQVGPGAGPFRRPPCRPGPAGGRARPGQGGSRS